MRAKQHDGLQANPARCKARPLPQWVIGICPTLKINLPLFPFIGPFKLYPPGPRGG